MSNLLASRTGLEPLLQMQSAVVASRHSLLAPTGSLRALMPPTRIYTIRMRRLLQARSGIMRQHACLGPPWLPHHHPAYPRVLPSLLPLAVVVGAGMSEHWLRVNRHRDGHSPKGEVERGEEHTVPSSALGGRRLAPLLLVVVVVVVVAFEPVLPVVWGCIARSCRQCRTPVPSPPACRNPSKRPTSS